MGYKKYIFILIAGFLWTADVLSGHMSAKQKFDKLVAKSAKENPYAGMQDSDQVQPKISRATFNTLYYPLKWWTSLRDGDYPLYLMWQLQKDFEAGTFNKQDFIHLRGKYQKPQSVLYQLAGRYWPDLNDTEKQYLSMALMPTNQIIKPRLDEVAFQNRLESMTNEYLQRNAETFAVQAKQDLEKLYESEAVGENV